MAGNDPLARLSWQDFEHLLAEHYREQGYRVEYAAQAQSLAALATAGGLDMRLHRGSESVIVRCNHWDADEVPLLEVNELLGAMLHEAATRGVLITRGRFTSEARAAVRRQPRLHLVDGDVLRVLLKLPDHLDTSVPGARPAERVARQARESRRATRRSETPRLVPYLVGVAVLALLAVFIWRASTARRQDEPTPTVVTQQPAAVPAPVAVPAAALPSAPVTPPPPPQAEAHGTPDALQRELAERARLRASSAGRGAPQQSEDALKVMSRNTREVGRTD